METFSSCKIVLLEVAALLTREGEHPNTPTSTAATRTFQWLPKRAWYLPMVKRANRAILQAPEISTCLKGRMELFCFGKVRLQSSSLKAESRELHICVTCSVVKLQFRSR
ncbi:uncharacterized protein LOC141599558 isoform X2 [Silene latifolia]|uniref:uncharacterized protein LOC141599558 isoform X2 n=1 Tax=Silene latifolia TaxID=37657 RepID=UPI003D780053